MDKRTFPVRCYLGLGSNLNNPVKQLHSAIKGISHIPDTALISQSHFYQSAPLYPPAQPDYINAVAAIDTQLSAHRLLQYLQKIEREHGRIRTTVRFGARTLDLDLLLYGNRVINTPKLVVPHPGITTRNFVLYPLFEIAPDLCLPSGTPLKDLLSHCPKKGLSIIN